MPWVFKVCGYSMGIQRGVVMVIKGCGYAMGI
jgi:hypothetical protein